MWPEKPGTALGQKPEITSLLLLCFRGSHFAAESIQKTLCALGNRGTLLRHVRQLWLYAAHHLQDQLLSRILRIDLSPTVGQQNPKHSRGEGQESSREHQERSRQEDFLLRHVGRVQDLYARDFFSLLNLCQFILLGQGFKHGLFHFGMPEQVGISNAKQGQLANRGINRVVRRSGALRRAGRSSHLADLQFQFAHTCLHGANAHIVVRENLAKSLQFRPGSDQLPLQQRRRFHHRFALLLDIDRAILAGELAELLFRGFQLLLHLGKSLLKENTFAVSGRRVELRDHVIQLRDIFLGHRAGPLWVAVGHLNREDAALPVYAYV